MKYEIKPNEIIVYDTSDFNVKQTFDCGQIFRYIVKNMKGRR